MTIRELAVRLGIKTDPRGFRRAEAGLQRIAGFARAAVAALATFKGIQAVRGIAEDIRVMGDRADKVSQQLGLTVQALQELEFAGGLAGVSNEEMALSLRQLARTAVEAADGAAEYADEYRKIGVNIRDSNGQIKSADRLIEELADGLRFLGTDTERVAIAQTLLGRSGSKLLPLLNGGSKAIRAQREEARQLGVMNEQQVKMAVELTDNQLRLSRAYTMIKIVIAERLLPTINRAVVGLTAFFQANRKIIGQALGKFFSRVARIISALGTFIVHVAKSTKQWFDNLGPVAQRLAKIAAIAATIAIALLLPGGSILLLIALIALLIEDFEMWRKGGESVIGDIIQGFKDLVAYIKDAVLGAIESIGAEFNAISDGVKDWVKENENAFAIIQSMALGFAAVVGVGLVKAYGAATASALAFKLWTVKYYAVIAASWLKTQFLMRMAALKSAAAWLLSTAGLVLTALLLTIIVGTLIWLGSELIKLIKGEENFFSTMHQGIKDLSEEWGGLGGAIGAMLDTALRYWLKFFGLSEDEIDTWIDNLTTTLETFWENVFVFWRQQFKDFFGWAGELFDTVAKAIGFGVETPEGAAGTAARPGAAGTIAGGGRIAATTGAGRGALINQGQQTNTFNVTARPGESDEDLARRLAEMVPPMIARENDRNLKAAARDYALEAS